jgi:hypothetical protein
MDIARVCPQHGQQFDQTDGEVDIVHCEHVMGTARSSWRAWSIWPARQPGSREIHAVASFCPRVFELAVQSDSPVEEIDR